MSRSLLLLVFLIGSIEAWNYGRGYDSHPWVLKETWMKRSSDLPAPAVRAKAQEVNYIHRKRSEDSNFPTPIARTNAGNVIYSPSMGFSEVFDPIY